MRRGIHRRAGAIAGLVLAVALTGCAAIDRVSVASDGSGGTGPAGVPDLSADGRYLAFASTAADLVADDTNGLGDVFVRDQRTGITERVSVSTTEVQADGSSNGPTISADGRFVVFTSSATALTGATVAGQHPYLRDRESGTTARLDTMERPESQSFTATISGDGRYVAYVTGASPAPGVVLESVVTIDLTTRTRTAVAFSQIQPPITPAQFGSLSVSTDGRYVAYGSTSTHSGLGLTFTSVGVWDRTTGQTANVQGAGSPNRIGPVRVSGDGRAVIFSTTTDAVPEDDTCPSDLADVPLPPQCDEDVFRYDVATQAIAAIAPDLPGEHRAVDISDDGGRILFTTTSGGATQFRVSHATTSRMVSPALTAPAGGGLSGDGYLVAFTSADELDPRDTDGVDDVFVRRVTIPTVTNVQPVSIRPGETAVATVTGRGFERGSDLVISGGVTVGSVTIVDATTMRAELHVAPDADPGARGVLVVTPGRFPSTGVGRALGACGGCFTVGP